jgi:AAA ATPase domain
MTEESRRVHVSGGRGVVVGDYATVFQSFAQSPPPIASCIRTAQFRALVDERTKNFVGREFVFAEIGRALAGEEFASGYAVIRGEPGIGKTSLAASLVVRRGYVHHFNVAAENIRSPAQFLQNVCAQLIVRYDLGHSALPPQAEQDAGFLSQVLMEAAGVARERGDLPVVVVVDALDEAEDVTLPAAANRLYLPRALPDGVFFVVTTREETDFRLDVDHGTEIWIREEDPANKRDVARYVEAFVAGHAEDMDARMAEWEVSQEVFVAEMISLSEGNFMYLVHVLPQLARGQLGRPAPGGLAGLPHGLKHYYQRHWREMKDANPDRFARLQRPVLCFLATSRDPVTVSRLREWTGLEPGDIRAVIGEWREFLNEEPGSGPPCYRLYHRSFADFLDEAEDLRWYHDQISETIMAKFHDVPGLRE